MEDEPEVCCRNIVADTLQTESTTGEPSETSTPILAQEAIEMEATPEKAEGQKTVDHNGRKLSSESQDTAESNTESEKNVKIEEHGGAKTESASNVGKETTNSPGLKSTTSDETFKVYGTGELPNRVQKPVDGGNQEHNSTLKSFTDSSIPGVENVAPDSPKLTLINKDYIKAEFSDNGQTFVGGDQKPAPDVKDDEKTSNLDLVKEKLDAGNAKTGGLPDIIKDPKDENDQKFNSELSSAERHISHGKSAKADAEDTERVATGDTDCVETDANKTVKLSDSEKNLKTVEGGQEHGSERPYANNSNISCRKEKECEKGTLAKDNKRHVGKETLDSPNLTPSEFIGTGQKYFVENAEEVTSEVQHGAQGGCSNEVSGKEEQLVKVSGCSTSSKLVKPSNQSAFENLTTSNEVRTLEDCLEAFGMFPRLLQLDESLEKVRRGRNTARNHEMACERLDKDLQKLSREYHPDGVMQRGGTEVEITRAKELQAALNATRTVLKTLSKIFLEDMDIEHKYEFYTKLDIGLLGNEDEVEKHAYQVLFNISLISEIKQGTIVGDIKRFLSTAQKCVRIFSESGMYFTEYRSLAFSFLERCVSEYKKLYTEHEEVEMQCRKENLRNIYPTIHKMKRECSMQLKHLEALLDLSKRPFGELFPMYSSTFPVDDYLVLPFVCYTNVILSCSLMHKLASEEQHKEGGWFGFSLSSLGALLGKTRSSSCHFDITSDDISLLYQLALCYGGNAECTRSVKELFGWRQASKEIVKAQFLETLEHVRMDLERRFKLIDYVVKNCTMNILKELKVYRRMTSEITERTRGFENDLEEMNKNNDYMRRRLDEVMRKQSEVSNELGEMSRRTSPNQN